jgi:hypothetical protein
VQDDKQKKGEVLALPGNAFPPLKGIYKKNLFCQEILSGEFKLEGNSFFIKGVEYKIRQRKKITPKKTGLFLCAFRNKKFFEYVSSLYPESKDEGVYRFDYRGVYYLMRIDKDRVKIYNVGYKKQCEGKSDRGKGES